MLFSTHKHVSCNPVLCLQNMLLGPYAYDRDFRVWEKKATQLHNIMKGVEPAFSSCVCAHPPLLSKFEDGALRKCLTLTENEQEKFQTRWLWVHKAIIEAEKKWIGGQAKEAISLSLSLFLVLLFCFPFFTSQSHAALPSLGSQLLPWTVTPLREIFTLLMRTELISTFRWVLDIIRDTFKRPSFILVPM
jgi:hypothetical protein